MSIDASQKQPSPSVPDLTLPEIVGIKIRQIPFKAPKHRNFKSRLSPYTRAVEFMVHLKGPVPVRAFGPALYVGDVAVTEGTKVRETLYRFLAFNLEQLEPGAPIWWGWMKDPKELWKRTKFLYKI
jgi:hypothetical protein